MKKKTFFLQFQKLQGILLRFQTKYCMIKPP